MRAPRTGRREPGRRGGSQAKQSPRVWLAKAESEKIEAVTGLYNRIGVKLLCENKMSEYNNKALESLAAVNVTAERKRELDKLIKELMYREV